LFGARRGHFYGDTRAGFGANGQFASSAAGAGAHSAEAHAAWPRGAQALAVIANGETDSIAFGAEADGHAGSGGMARDVGQGFLHDAEQVRFGFIRQTLFEFGSVLDFDAGA